MSRKFFKCTDGNGLSRRQPSVEEGSAVPDMTLQGMAVCNDANAVGSCTEVSAVRPVCSSHNMHGETEKPMRVATLNVRGLAARRRQYQVSRLFLENDLDLVAVQETKIESEDQTARMVETFRTR